MRWLLLVIIAEVNGDLTVNVMSDHETMAECHVAATYISWEEMTANKEMMCFPFDREVKK